MHHLPIRKLLFPTVVIVALALLSCDPLVSTFDEVENAQMYQSVSKEDAPDSVTQIKVMTWNIRFGAGRMKWFGDSCGDRVIMTTEEVERNLQGIADAIESIQPDIIVFNEIDIESKRSDYIDQVQWLLDHTYFNYGTFASNWKSQFIPSDGLGRMNMGNAILSRWKIHDAERIKLPLRGDQDALTQYFYLRRNIIKARIDVPGLDNFYMLGVHLAAFSVDDTKQRQIHVLLEEMRALDEEGAYFVLAGDFNLLPPVATKTDYCLQDMCAGESFHGQNDDPRHKEGSYFTPEMTWLNPLYEKYHPAVELDQYLANEADYFTHTPIHDGFWDRKIDYLWTNYQWLEDSDETHQDIDTFSDHVCVSCIWEVPE